MNYGFGVPTRGPLANPADITTLAREGEALGFAFVFVNDHIVVPRRTDSRYPYSQSGAWAGGRTGEALELLSLLSYLAGVTTRARLLTSIMVVPYRSPVLAAKVLATIDVLSGGRLTIGCGTGWMREEFEAIGTAPFAARGAVTDEYLAVFKTLWTDDAPRFAGEFAAFDAIRFLPKPVQKPHPPLWIGGESGRAHRRTAALGDCWYPIGCNPRQPLDSPEKFAAGRDKLHQAIAAAGRDPAEIGLAYGAVWYGDGARRDSSDGGRMVFTGEDDEIAADIGRFGELGVNDVMLNFRAEDLNEMLDLMAHFIDDIAPS